MWKSITNAGLISLTVFIANIANGQTVKIDSLRFSLKNQTNDYRKITTLNLLSREIYLIGKYDSSAICANDAKLLSEKLNYKKGIATAITNLGNIEMTGGDFDTALLNFDEARSLYKSIGDAKGVGASYNNIGNIHLSRGDFQTAQEHYYISLKIRAKIRDKQGMADCFNNLGIINYYQANFAAALKCYLAALKILKEVGNKNGIARSYSNIGSIYLQQADVKNALESFINGLKIQKEIDDQMGMGRSYNNIASVYLYEGKYDKSLENFLIALKIKEEIGDFVSLGQTYLNIGNISYVKIGDEKYDLVQRDSLMDKAHEYYYKSLEIFNALGDKQGMAMAYNSIGTVHVSKSEPEEALKFLKQGLGFATEVGSVNDIGLSYIGLAAADSAKGDWESAYQNRVLYGRYRDSLLNVENIRETEEERLNFVFEQEKIETKAEHDIKEGVFIEKIKWQKVIGWTSVATFALILLTTFLWFNRRRLKEKSVFQQKLAQQQKEQATAIIETQEQERKRIAEDLHDSMGHLLSTVKLNLQNLPDDQKHHYANSISLLNQASTEMHNISFNLMPQTLEDEGLIPALYELADKIKKSSLYDILLQVHDMDNFVFDNQMKYNIYRIVQEAVNNILKHAEAKEISIQLIKLDEFLTIMIEDDGKGFNMSEVKMTGRGLRNITARSEWLHGSITIDSTPGRGTTIAIEIPINKQEND